MTTGPLSRKLPLLTTLGIVGLLMFSTMLSTGTGISTDGSVPRDAPRPAFAPTQGVSNVTEVWSTPILPYNKTRTELRPAAATYHWWLIDYWDAPNTYGRFTAASNTIVGLAPGDDVLILPLNLGYGAPDNFVWFQFDIDFNGGAAGWSNNIWWAIWNIPNCPNNCAYNPEPIGLSYVPGHAYHYQGSTYNILSILHYFRFQIWDDTAGTNWYWDFSIPSESPVSNGPAFCPASAVEGYTTPASVSSVPYYQFTVGYGMTSYNLGQFGSGLPKGLGVDQRYLGGTPSTWYWEMVPLATVTVYSVDLQLKGQDPALQSDLHGSISNSYQNSASTTTYSFQVPMNTQITFSVSSSPSGWTFANWWDDYGYAQSNTQTLTINVGTSNHKVAAFFTQKQYTITANTSPPGLDSPQGGGTYTQGTVITVSVSDVTGYTFIKWQRDGADWTTQKSFQYTVDASHTFTANYAILVTTTVTLTQTSTSYSYLTTTTTSTSYTSTTTSTSTIPTVTTVVLVPLTITSTEQSTQFLTSVLTTTTTSYTDTTTLTSTIPTTVALVQSTVTSIVQSIQYLTSILSTTTTSYTSTQTSTSTVVVPTTVVLVPLTATSTIQSTQSLSSTATTTVTSYTSTATLTSTVPTVTTVVLLPNTTTSTVQSTQFLTSTLTTTTTSYTDTTTSTSTSVVYTTVTASPKGAGPAGAGTSSPVTYLGFLSLLAVGVGRRVNARKGWRIQKVRSLMQSRYCSSWSWRPREQTFEPRSDL